MYRGRHFVVKLYTSEPLRNYIITNIFFPTNLQNCFHCHKLITLSVTLASRTDVSFVATTAFVSVSYCSRMMSVVERMMASEPEGIWKEE